MLDNPCSLQHLELDINVRQAAAEWTCCPQTFLHLAVVTVCECTVMRRYACMNPKPASAVMYHIALLDSMGLSWMLEACKLSRIHVIFACVMTHLKKG